MIVHQCDRKDCSAKSIQPKGSKATTPEGWYAFGLAGQFGINKVYYEICKGCRVALKIPDTAPDANVGERLLEIIEDLVTDAVEAQVSEL